jgi:hypothetical protein
LVAAYGFLGAGLTKASFYEPMVNRTYADMARHYRTAIVPARPYNDRAFRSRCRHVLGGAADEKPTTDIATAPITAPHSAGFTLGGNSVRLILVSGDGPLIGCRLPRPVRERAFAIRRVA